MVDKDSFCMRKSCHISNRHTFDFHASNWYVPIKAVLGNCHNMYNNFLCIVFRVLWDDYIWIVFFRNICILSHLFCDERSSSGEKDLNLLKKRFHKFHIKTPWLSSRFSFEMAICLESVDLYMGGIDTTPFFILNFKFHRI